MYDIVQNLVLFLATLLITLGTALGVTLSVKDTAPLQPRSSEIAVETPSTEAVVVERPSTSSSPPQDELPPVADLEPQQVSPPQPPAAQTTSAVQNLSSSVANQVARASLVNIVCITERARSIETVTGSGVLIDPRGVVLTNAHIGQYFLLPNETSCLIRTGSPAQATYEAELLYLPPTWIYEHAAGITEQNPVGTGESDYAFLYLKQDDTNARQPLPHLAINTIEEAVDLNEEVLVVGYPVLIHESDVIRDELYLISTTADVEALYTFTEHSLDLFALSGNVVAQRGASGGAVVSREGKLVGLVVTSTDDELVTDRQLRALSLAYIDRTLKAQNSTTIRELLNHDLKQRIESFEENWSPILRERLLQEL
jgi:hypothetical protein